MRRIMFPLLLACVIAGSDADAKKSVPHVRYEVEPAAQWGADGISLRFRATLDRGLKATESVILLPVYIAGGDTVPFPSLTFITDSGERFRERRERSGGESGGMTVVMNHKKFPPFDYSRTIPSPTRRGGRLVIGSYFSSCCDSARMESVPVDIDMPADAVRAGFSTALLQQAFAAPCPTEPCTDLPEPVLRVPLDLTEANVTLLCPEAETVKTRDTNVTLHLHYPSGRHDIDPLFNGNDSELAALDKALRDVTENPEDYTLNSITVTGYASPEGMYESNLSLSERRAYGLKRYIADRYGISPALIRTDGKGEDWAGLVRLVEEDGFPGSREVIDIIRRYSVHGGREKRLMDLRGGDPYRHMLWHLFPQLRRLEAKVDYEVRGFDGKEAAERIATSPADLSLREMWDAARSSGPAAVTVLGRENYGAEYYAMARYFPDSDIACLNAASAALVRGDLASARKFLASVETSPLSANDTGLYFWMCGMPAEAKAYFRIAMLTEPEKSAYNLRELEKWENQ